MSDRAHLTELLEDYYRGCGWQPERHDDGTVRARGIGGVTWIGLPVTASDIDDPRFTATLLELSDTRMPTGERCPLELLPDPGCASDLQSVLEALRLADRGHVEVYAVAA